MVAPVLNAEQARVLKDAREAVELIDAVGTRPGIVVRPPSAAEVAHWSDRPATHYGV